MRKVRNRAPDRPHEGDARPCPFCRTGVMLFQESESGDAQPGWFCSCGYRNFVRQPAKPSMAARLRALNERRAKAFRKSMKVRARAARLQQDSTRIKAAR